MSEQLENKTRHQDNGHVDQNEFHLLDLLIVLVRHKKLVIGMPLAAGIAALAASMLITPTYTSTAKVMPPQQATSGLSAMLGQLGGLASVASSAAGVKNPSDLYVGMLESRTLADVLIERFKLQERYESRTMDDARLALARMSEIGNGKKDGLISIAVSDKDPKFAADLANAYFDELTKMTQTMAISEASQRRLFFERQLKETKDELANAEVALRITQEKTGMLEPKGQVQAIISSAAQLKATIAAKEVQLNAMRTFATAQNPDMMRAQEELRGLHAQLAKLEKRRPSQDADFMVPTAALPAAGVEYVRSLRNVKYYETLFELLSKQYEVAKIDEAKEASTLQLLDKAIPAQRESKPKRALITILGVLGGGVFGALLAFAYENYTRSRRHSDNRNRWQELSTAWKQR